MQMKFKIISLILVLTLIFLPTQSVAAAGLADGKVIFGDSFTLKSGESLQGDLVVIGGNATVEGGASVHGSVVVIGGQSTIEGTVNGDALVMGGLLTLGANAVVNGDLVSFGGSLERDPNATITGDIVANAPLPDTPDVSNVPVVPGLPEFDWVYNPFADVLGTVFRSVGLAMLAMLLVLFLEPQIRRVALASVEQPLIAGGIGLLSAVVIVFSVVTIILIPLSLLAALLFIVGWVFGLIAIGQEVGVRIMRAFNQEWHPALSIGLGTLLLMLVTGMVDSVIPCIGWMLPALVGFIGVGGVIMTVFGTRPHQAAAQREKAASSVLPPAVEE